MEKILNYIDDYFIVLFKKFGFFVRNEINDDQTLSVEFCTKTFVVKLEKYRQEFYATLYKIGFPEHEINLFNLIQYLNQDSNNVLESNYFVNEKNLGERYKKQLKHIVSTIFDYFLQIDEFFKHDNFCLELEKLNKFMQDKYPELFVTV